MESEIREKLKIPRSQSTELRSMRGLGSGLGFFEESGSSSAGAWRLVDAIEMMKCNREEEEEARKGMREMILLGFDKWRDYI